MPYFVAAIVAALLLLVEQHWSERLWFKADALGWWVARAGQEACFAAILAGFLISLPGVSFHSDLLLGAVAGLAGPRVFGRISLPFRERNLNPINLAYQRVTELCNQCIDESSAEAQRAYVENVITPAVEREELDSKEIAEAFRRHLHGRRLMKDADRSQRLNFITEILNDPISEKEKVAALVFKAWDIGAYSTLEEVVKSLPRGKGRPALTLRKRIVRIRRCLVKRIPLGE